MQVPINKNSTGLFINFCHKTKFISKNNPKESFHCSDLSNMLSTKQKLPFIGVKQENQICKSAGNLLALLFLIYQQLYWSWKQFLRAAPGQHAITAPIGSLRKSRELPVWMYVCFFMSDFWWNRFPQYWQGYGLVSEWMRRCVESVEERLNVFPHILHSKLFSWLKRKNTKRHTKVRNVEFPSWFWAISYFINFLRCCELRIISYFCKQNVLSFLQEVPQAAQEVLQHFIFKKFKC